MRSWNSPAYGIELEYEEQNPDARWILPKFRVQAPSFMVY